jgi:hypothetical protein
LQHNPEGHSPKWWNRHKEAREHATEVEATATSKPKMPAPEGTHHGLDFLLGGFALLAEFVAVAYGETWLAWAAAALFVAAFYEYTKAFLNRQPQVVRWLVTLTVSALLLFAVRHVIGIMEKNIHARMASEPRLQFSVLKDKTIVLDNSKGDTLTDFQISAMEYWLDMRAFGGDHAVIATRNPGGGDITFEHFDVRGGEVKRIGQADNIRYAFIIQRNRLDPSRAVFDSLIHYICLRIAFTREESGERYVHYLVISPYENGFDFTEHPEAAESSGPQPPGRLGFIYSISQTIKADARSYYGTEDREYKR